MMKLFTASRPLSIVFAVFMIGSVESVLSCQAQNERIVYDNLVVVSSNCLSIPAGRVVLIRKDGALGGVKFLNYTQYDGVEEYFAEYESTVFERGKGISKRSIYKGSLSHGRSYGIGRFSYRFGKMEVLCGGWRLFWPGGSSICFFGQGQPQKDNGYEFAPTQWLGFDNVDFSDRRIKWYKYDEDRGEIAIKILDLWNK